MMGFISRALIGVAVAILPVFVGWFAASPPAAAAVVVQRAHVASVSSYMEEASHDVQGVRLQDANPWHPCFDARVSNGSQIAFVSLDERLGDDRSRLHGIDQRGLGRGRARQRVRARRPCPDLVQGL